MGLYICPRCQLPMVELDFPAPVFLPNATYSCMACHGFTDGSFKDGHLTLVYGPFVPNRTELQRAAKQLYDALIRAMGYTSALHTIKAGEAAAKRINVRLDLALDILEPLLHAEDISND